MTNHNERDSKAAEDNYPIGSASKARNEGVSEYAFQKARQFAFIDGLEKGRAEENAEWNKTAHIVEMEMIKLRTELTAIKATLAVATEALRYYAKESSWYCHKDHTTGAEVRRSIELADTETFSFQESPHTPSVLRIYAGKKAKEALAEIAELSAATTQKGERDEKSDL